MIVTDAILRRYMLLVALVLVLVPRAAHAGYMGAAFVDQRGTDEGPSGVLVTKVAPGGPAAKANIQPKDLVVAIDNRPATSAAALADIVRRGAPGSPLGLKILREGRLVPVVLLLAASPEDMADLQRGIENLQKGLHDQAIADFSKAIGRDPGKAEPYFYRAKAYEKQQKYDLSVIDYSRAIQLNPQGFSSYASRGYVYEKMRLYDQAVQDFTKAIEIEPKMAPIYVDRGRAYFSKGLYDQAVADCTRAIELLPKMDIAYLGRAAAYEAKGMKREATADRENAARAYVESGLDSAKKGELDHALRKFDSAIKLNTKHSSSAYCNRGVVYEKKKDYLQAVNDYSEAIRLNPRYAEAYLRRGHVFARGLGDYRNAQQDWEKTLELDPSGEMGRSAKEGLEKLNSVQSKP